VIPVVAKTAMNYQTLKARQRLERHTRPPNLALRVHRALSWLNRAEQLADDRDGHFIFLWIAFNAAYATDLDEKYRASERALFHGFLQKLIALDDRNAIQQLVWTEFSGNIRLLLDNKYIYQDFWNHRNGKLTEAEWSGSFADANKAARRARSARQRHRPQHRAEPHVHAAKPAHARRRHLEQLGQPQSDQGRRCIASR